MLIFWSLVRNSVVLAVYLLFSVACFFTVHEHCCRACRPLHRTQPPQRHPGSCKAERGRGQTREPDEWSSFRRVRSMLSEKNRPFRKNCDRPTRKDKSDPVFPSSLYIAACHTSSLFYATACHMTRCIIKTAALIFSRGGGFVMQGFADILPRSDRECLIPAGSGSSPVHHICCLS